jgi:UDP-N-acetylmuramate dehydrogenase
LIEAAGLKGRRVGRAIISPIHANFIINLEGATAQDIYSLMRIAQETVLEKFNIKLEPEIELIGEFENV